MSDRLYALMYPTGRWDEPCLVTCACGYQQTAATCEDAKAMAWAHDREHWAGRHVQGVLLLEASR